MKISRFLRGIRSGSKGYGSNFPCIAFFMKNAQIRSLLDLLLTSDYESERRKHNSVITKQLRCLEVIVRALLPTGQVRLSLAADYVVLLHQCSFHRADNSSPIDFHRMPVAHDMI